MPPPARSNQRSKPARSAPRPNANLNQRLESRHMASLRRGPMYMKVAFNPTDIVGLIMHALKFQKTSSVVGCVAWLSHPLILKQLAKKPCSIVVTRDKSNAKKHVRTMYMALKPADIGYHRSIKFLGAKAGRIKTRMHHKFLVGLDDNGNPIWVLTGSFNMSSNATKNLENIMYVSDKELAHVYYEEWQKIWNCC